jgi:hypothetical protein
MTAALSFERMSLNLGEPVRRWEQAVEWAKQTGRLATDPRLRATLARTALDNRVAGLLGFRANWMAAQGELPSVEGSMAKLWTTESFVRAASALHDALGPEGVLQGETAPAGGWLEHAYRHAQVTTIYGGSSEIQRGIIAERGLGLPRTR